MSLYIGNKKITMLTVGGSSSGGSGGGLLQAKSVTPSEDAVNITPDNGFYGMSSVSVSGIPSDYIGSDVVRNSASGNVTLNNATATKTYPAGYYPNAHGASVVVTAYNNPAVSFNENTGVISVSHVQSAGYTPASTFSDTVSLSTMGAQTVIPSEEMQTVTTNKKYLTGNITVNPIPSTYVGSEVARLGANSYTPGKNSQTITSGKYLTGNQTILGDSNLVSANIKAGTTIFGVTGTYEGNVQGNDYSGATATSAHILSGYTAYTQDGLTSGSIATKTATSVTVSGNSVSIPSGYYATNVTKSVPTASHPEPTMSRSGNVITASHAQTTGYVTGGTTTSTMTLPSLVATEYTPGTADQVITANRWLSGAQTILGDENLVASNIADGVTIFGVTGTHQGGGSGLNTNDATATASDLLSGTTAYVRGVKITGNIPTKTNSDITLTGSSVNIPKGYFANATTFALPSVEVATPAITIDSTSDTKSVTITSTVNQSDGYTVGGVKTATAKITGIPAQIYVPSTRNQTISSGLYLCGTQTIQGDSNLIASNIRVGATIFGVSGTYDGSGGIDTSNADATESDILYGKTAYADGVLLTGTIPVNNTLPEPWVYFENGNDNEMHGTYTLPRGYYQGGTCDAIVFKLNRLNTTRYTPGTSDQTISAGQYNITSNITIDGDVDLIPENIKSGVSIFGVDGTFTSDATADAMSIVSGKTAYVNGNKVTGWLTMTDFIQAIPDGVTVETIEENDGKEIFEIKKIVPTTSDIYLSVGAHVFDDNIRIKGDENLVPGNIADGVTIFGVTGTHQGGLNRTFTIKTYSN